jgi:hypothetical protein
MSRISFVCLSLSVTLAACTGDKDDDSNTATTDDSGNPTDECKPTKVSCQDEMVLDLALHEEVTEGKVATTKDGDDFVTTIDASAGGYTDAANNPWTYVKFGSDGAVRVEIGDETALTSQDWDLAAHRFVLRLNGGSSGPSCVGAAAVPKGDYATIDKAPAGVTYRTDDFYTDDCSFINDSSSLDGSPQVVLGPWWEYPGCVATTDTPFLVQVADGRVLKLVVEQYYSHGEQEICNTTGAMGEHSGYYTIRWAWLPPA